MKESSVLSACARPVRIIIFFLADSDLLSFAGASGRMI
jgi:hypothetical protein